MSVDYFQWLHVEDDADVLPDFGVPVFIHSTAEGWKPGVSWRERRPGGGWEWTDDFESEHDGIEYFAYIPALPAKQITGATPRKDVTERTAKPAKKTPVKKVAKKAKT